MTGADVGTVGCVRPTVDGQDGTRGSDGAGAARDRALALIAARDRVVWPALRDTLGQIAAVRSPHRPQVLDCGGGSGSLAVPLAVLGASVVVLDTSIDALATLARRADEAGVAERVDGVQGDVDDLGVRQLGGLVPVRPHVDLVLAHGVLAGAEDPPAVLRRMIDALAPGGALSVVIANPVAAVLARAISGDVAGALGALTRGASGSPPAGPAATGSEVTGSEATGSEMTGSEATGSEATGSEATGSELLDGEMIAAACAQGGLTIEVAQGIDVLAGLVPGAALQSAPGAVAALMAFEQAAAQIEPYRSIASRLHIIARRPG